MGKKVWKGATFVNSPAVEGVWENKNPDTASGCGGASLAIAPQAAKYIVTSGILPEGRGAWAILENYHSMPKLGILCIYASNHKLKHCRLWALLKNSLPADIPWVWWGDYNMAEGSEDQIGEGVKNLGGTELLVWSAVKAKF